MGDVDRLSFENLPPKTTDFLWIQKGGSKHLPVEIFELIPNLEGISLSVGIEGIQQSDFKNAGKISTISLPGNDIRELPTDVFASAKNLSKIEIDSSNVAEIKDFALRGLETLEKISLVGNQLRVIRRNTFAGAPNLEDVILGSNDIDTIEEGAFDLPKLRTLYLNGNKLKGLPELVLAAKPDLWYLNLGSNELITVPTAVLKPSNLTELVLDSNDLEDLVGLSKFLAIKRLERLSLVNTGVAFGVYSEDPEPKRNEKLTHLDISNNSLSNEDILLELSQFEKLEWLTMKHNDFVSLTNVREFLKRLDDFLVVDLIGNPLKASWVKENEPIFLEEGCILNTMDEDNEDYDESEEEDPKGAIGSYTAYTK